MHYIDKAKSVFVTGHAKLTEIKTVLTTIQRINFKVPTQQYRQLSAYYNQMKIDLDELNLCLEIHEAMSNPDDETIASVIQAEAEVYAGICDVEELIKILLGT